MDKRTVITLSGVGALAVFAVVAKSAVMFVSACAIAIVVYLFRGARTRERVIAVVVAALGGSLLAEIVHTIYHHVAKANVETADELGGFFMAAIQIGLINAAFVVAFMILVALWFRLVGRRSRNAPK